MILGAHGVQVHQCAPVYKAGGVEFCGAAVVAQCVGVRAGGEVGAVHEADEGAHDAVDVGHLRVPAAHQVLCQVILRLFL